MRLPATSLLALGLGLSAAVFATSLLTLRFSGIASPIAAPSFEIKIPSAPVRSWRFEPNLFDAALEAPLAPVAPDATTAPLPPGKLMLIGLIAPRAAMIRNFLGDTVGLFRVGDGVFGRTEFLKSVSATSVTIRGPYGTRKLELGVGPDQQAPLVETISPPRPGGPSVGIDISRSEINASGQSAEQILGETKIGPEIRDGRIIGFRVAQVADNSIVGKMGIMKDDIIKSINGQPLDSLERATRIWENLKSVSQIHMTFEREGQDKLLSYFIKP